MPALTPDRGYPYPLTGDSGDVPAAIEAFAEAVDLDMQALASSISQRPMVKVASRTARQTFPPRTNTEVSFDFVDIDTNGAANLSAQPTRIVPKLAGWWYCWGAVTPSNQTFTNSRQLQLRRNVSESIAWNSPQYFAQSPALHVIHVAGMGFMNGSTDSFSMVFNPAGPTDETVFATFKYMAAFRIWGP